MTYLIVANLNYTTQANRNTALTNINNVLAGYTVTSVASSQPAGVNTNGTTGITISIECNDADANALSAALLPAWTATARVTTGYHIGTFKIR